MSGDPGLRERLVQAALALLEEQGAVPSLRAVARAAGVSAMTPYTYFSDKAALMGAVADRGFAVMALKLEDADGHDDPVEALVAQGIAFVAFAQSNPALFRLIYTRSAAERLAHLLLHMVELYGVEAPDGTLIAAPFTRTDLAAMIGSTRQWVAASLKRLDERGIVEPRDDQMLVRSLPRLRDVRDGKAAVDGEAM